MYIYINRHTNIEAVVRSKNIQDLQSLKAESQNFLDPVLAKPDS